MGCRCASGQSSLPPTLNSLLMTSPLGLQVLAGKYMVGQDVVQILGRPAFHDLALTSSGALSYLGPQWRRDIAFAGAVGFSPCASMQACCHVHAVEAMAVHEAAPSGVPLARLIPGPPPPTHTTPLQEAMWPCRGTSRQGR